ncbi:hypothetical protein KIN20_024670 [Parelaphostrongylus tenuis]|uniref:Uncharacterized protein n=1 Tax=Parelaphostrongylus tenuis TaxID=148309 RepID=A0AAD5MTV2_PARTN|nr:hypothetical protein KIN20_024670 [Parelaphostrongylus tenuis]
MDYCVLCFVVDGRYELRIDDFTRPCVLSGCFRWEGAQFDGDDDDDDVAVQIFASIHTANLLEAHRTATYGVPGPLTNEAHQIEAADWSVNTAMAHWDTTSTY